MKIIACIDDSDYGHHAFVTAMSLMNKGINHEILSKQTA